MQSATFSEATKFSLRSIENLVCFVHVSREVFHFSRWSIIEADKIVVESLQSEFDVFFYRVANVEVFWG